MNGYIISSTMPKPLTMPTNGLMMPKQTQSSEQFPNSRSLDPAVGSGAFPMGMLHKLTLALRRLDPDNTRWEKLQKERAVQRAEVAFDTQDDKARREELVEIDETFKRYRDSDFGRKLYLIQNSIFGVDIQPVACQIAKLRFFISLAIEQEPEQTAENFGIKPLPNFRDTLYRRKHTDRSQGTRNIDEQHSARFGTGTARQPRAAFPRHHPPTQTHLQD